MTSSEAFKFLHFLIRIKKRKTGKDTNYPENAFKQCTYTLKETYLHIYSLINSHFLYLWVCWFVFYAHTYKKICAIKENSFFYFVRWFSIKILFKNQGSSYFLRYEINPWMFVSAASWIIYFFVLSSSNIQS